MHNIRNAGLPATSTFRVFVYVYSNGNVRCGGLDVPRRGPRHFLVGSDCCLGGASRE